MIAWMIACVQQGMERGSASQSLHASCRDTEAERIALLRHYGCVKQEWRSVRMVRSLNLPFPAPYVPAGFSIQHVTGEHQVQALVDLYRAAFGTQNMTVQERLAMMRVPGYDPELD
jgi:hypothetical protein